MVKSKSSKKKPVGPALVHKLKFGRTQLIVLVALAAIIGATKIVMTFAAVPPGNTLDPTAENLTFSYVNQWRNQHGEASVAQSRCLTDAAREWAVHQGIANLTGSAIAHSNLTASFAKNCGNVGWANLGEIMLQATNVNDSVTAAQVAVNGWKNSPEHNSIMLNAPYNFAGMGVYYDSLNHVDYFVEDFAQCVSNCGAVTISAAPISVNSTPRPFVAADSPGLDKLWGVTGGGALYLRGGASIGGDLRDVNVTNVVAMAVQPNGSGYWLAAGNGTVYNYGTAAAHGSISGLARPIVGMTATASGNGYWLTAGDGGVFSFGDARFYGSEGGKPLNQPVVGIKATKSSNGYWLVAADGGIFSFGDAKFYGSEGGKALSAPIVGMERTSDGLGYWLVGSDGGVFAFGDAHFYGSAVGKLSGNERAIGIVRMPGSKGYWIIASTGRIIHFGSATAWASWPQPAQ